MWQNELAVHRGTVVVSTMASDAHTWNLVFLQLLIEELGYRVRNLGPCVPDDVLVEEVRHSGADLVVLSSVNGHGLQDGLRVIPQLRACPELAAVPPRLGPWREWVPPRGHVFGLTEVRPTPNEVPQPRRSDPGE